MYSSIKLSYHYRGNIINYPALSFHHFEILPLINMHHGNPVFKPTESIYTVHIPDQRLQTLIRHSDNQLQIHLSGIFQTDCAPLLIHFGKRLIQQYQLDFGIPLTLLHIQHGKSSK